MDDFARLRQRIYAERRGSDWESIRDEMSRLGRVFLGDEKNNPGARALLDAAALRRTGPGIRVVELIEKAGSAPYLDRYIADAIEAHPEVGEDVDLRFLELASGNGNSPALLKLAASAGRCPFSSSIIARELAADEDSRRGAALSYIAVNGLVEFSGAVANLAEGESASRDEARRTLEDLDRETAPNATARQAGLSHPVAVIQSMFYGDPSRTGRGSSGGIGTLLQDLGSAMGKATGGVVTLVLYNRRTAGYVFVPVEQVDEYHSIVRMPLGLEEDSAYGFHTGHHALRRAFRRTLALHGITPVIAHVRYLDDASLAVARESVRAGVRLVSTITPDPHRSVCDPTGRIRSFNPAEGMEYLNRILIGDELVSRSRGLLAIGSGAMVRELLPYYPQLEDTRGRIMESLDEGVRLEITRADLDAEALLTAGGRYRLNTAELKRPLLLSVGRLARVKNQVALVRAWSQCAFRTHNLVLIGGDQESPSSEEAGIIREISETVDGENHLSGRFCHLPAKPNTVVRGIQAILADRPADPHFNVYVCPSLKEEFGLSIVEAMAAGMVVCAPLRGGARTYVRHGINGFLIDTSTDETLTSELNATVLSGRLGPERVTAIAHNARETVRRRYSMETVSARFADFYRRVQDG